MTHDDIARFCDYSGKASLFLGERAAGRGLTDEVHRPKSGLAREMISSRVRTNIGK